MSSRKTRRNEEIRRRVALGQTQTEVAEAFGVSRQRVEHIIRPRRATARRVAHEKVEIPQGTPCERCGVAEAEERHHPDYNKPHSVQLLCRKCHSIADRERWEEAARAALGLHPSVVLETTSEAARRASVSTRRIADAIRQGLVMSHDNAWARFVVPEEVDLAVSFYRQRGALRRRIQRATECAQGHLYLDWNIQKDGDRRVCAACNAATTRAIQGATENGIAPQYDICLAFHETGAVSIDAGTMKVEATYRDGLTLRASRGGRTNWIIREDAGAEFARVDTGEEAEREIRGFLADRLAAIDEEKGA